MPGLASTQPVDDGGARAARTAGSVDAAAPRRRATTPSSRPRPTSTPRSSSAPARWASTSREGEAVDGDRDRGDEREVEHDDGRPHDRAGYVVAADGHYSTVRRSSHPSPTATSARGTRSASTSAASTTDRLWVLFEADLLPGYAWVFPLPDGRANVGFGVLRDERHARQGSSKALWRDLLDRPALRDVLGPDAEPEAPPPRVADPDRVRPATR